MRFRSDSSMQRTKAASAAVSRHWWKAWRQPPHPCGSLCSAALRYRLQQPPPRRLNTCNHNYSIEIAAANKAPITSTHTRVWRQIHARHHASHTPLLAQYLYGSASHAVAGMSCKASVTSHTLGAAHAAADLFHVVHFCDAGSSGVAGGGARGEGPASASVDVNSCSIMSQEERGVVSASHRSVVVATVDNSVERALVLPLHP